MNPVEGTWLILCQSHQFTQKSQPLRLLKPCMRSCSSMTQLTLYRFSWVTQLTKTLGGSGVPTLPWISCLGEGSTGLSVASTLMNFPCITSSLHLMGQKAQQRDSSGQSAHFLQKYIICRTIKTSEGYQEVKTSFPK